MFDELTFAGVVKPQAKETKEKRSAKLSKSPEQRMIERQKGQIAVLKRNSQRHFSRAIEAEEALKNSTRRLNQESATLDQTAQRAIEWENKVKDKLAVIDSLKERLFAAEQAFVSVTKERDILKAQLELTLKPE